MATSCRRRLPRETLEYAPNYLTRCRWGSGTCIITREELGRVEGLGRIARRPGAAVVASLRPIKHLTIPAPSDPLEADRRPHDVSGETFHCGPVLGLDPHTVARRKPLWRHGSSSSVRSSVSYPTSCNSRITLWRKSNSAACPSTYATGTQSQSRVQSPRRHQQMHMWVPATTVTIPVV